MAKINKAKTGAASGVGNQAAQAPANDKKAGKLAGRTMEQAEGSRRDTDAEGVAGSKIDKKKAKKVNAFFKRVSNAITAGLDKLKSSPRNAELATVAGFDDFCSNVDGAMANTDNLMDTLGVGIPVEKAIARSATLLVAAENLRKVIDSKGENATAADLAPLQAELNELMSVIAALTPDASAEVQNLEAKAEQILKEVEVFAKASISEADDSKSKLEIYAALVGAFTVIVCLNLIAVMLSFPEDLGSSKAAELKSQIINDINEQGFVFQKAAEELGIL